MNKPVYYINGVGSISPQRTFNNDEFLPEISSYIENKLDCVLPEFKDYINPIQLRRLSRMLRAGLSAAIICLRDSNNQQPDGIITSTGDGFLRDTNKFLNEIFEFNEKQLTPTYFMQGTHNALAGLVALTLKCKGYNNTYVTSGLAFETSLHDAMMQLNADPDKTFLLGALDERDDAQYKIHLRTDNYKKEKINSRSLFDNPTRGTLQGEGTCFFSLSGQPGSNVWGLLKDVKVIHKPENANEIRSALHEVLTANDLRADQLDVLVNGVSGDVIHDQLLAEIVETELSFLPEVRFKHLCGEYCTASSFGLWLGLSILKKQVIPASVLFNGKKPKNPIKHVLLLNQYFGRNYSFILISSC